MTRRSDADVQIEEFVWRCVQEFRSVDLQKGPRDRLVESRITAASRVEYVFGRHLKSNQSLRQIFFGVDLDENQLMKGFLSYTEGDWAQVRTSSGALIRSDGPDSCSAWLSAAPTPLVRLCHLRRGEELKAPRPLLDLRLTEAVKGSNETIWQLTAELERERHFMEVDSGVPCDSVGFASSQPRWADFTAFLPANRKGHVFLRTTHFRTSRFLIPWFRVDEANRWFNFWPHGNTSPILYVEDLDAKKSSIVILTDNPELARLSKHSEMGRNANFVWLSWYGEERTASKVDWTPLAGRCVYYLLMEHSGFSAAEVHHTANIVRQSMERAGLTSPQFMTYPARQTLSEFPGEPQADVPHMLSKEEPSTCVEGRTSTVLASQSDLPSTHAWVRAGNTASAHPLLPPLLYERTATLVYGDAHSGKTWLALRIGLAVSLGKAIWEDWRASGRHHVLYLHGDLEGSPIIDRLKYLARAMSDGKANLTETMDMPTEFAAIPIPTLYGTGAGFQFLPINGTAVSLANVHYVTSLAELVMRLHLTSAPVLVILDGFDLLGKVVGGDGQSHPFSWWIHSLRQRGCALMVVLTNDTVPPHQLSRLKTRLPWDGIIKVRKRQTKSASTLGMSLKIEKGFKLPKTQARTINLEFSPSDEQARWTVVRRSVLSPEKQMQKVGQLAIAGKKDREIAEIVGISLALVKKRMRELREIYPDNQALRRRPSSKEAKESKETKETKTQALMRLLKTGFSRSLK